MDFKIDGIYDYRTISALYDHGIRRFGFDFRPLSTNYFQEVRFIKLLEKFDFKDCSIYLLFNNEAPFIVQKIVDDVLDRGIKNFTLQFMGEENIDYAKQFELPFTLNYSMTRDFVSTNMTLPFAVVKEAYEAGKILELSKLIMSADCSVELLCDWRDDIYPSLFTYFDFDGISYAISSDVETCYRNVNLENLISELTIARGNI